MPESSKPVPDEPSLCARGQISHIKMDSLVSSESQVSLFDCFS